METLTEIGRTLLNLAGLAGLIVGTLAAAAGFFWAISWFAWRLGRSRAGACASAIARGLSLTRSRHRDKRISTWRGRAMDAEIWVASPALWEGPYGRRLDPAGPGFVDGEPRIVFERGASVLVLVRYPSPMVEAFRAWTLRGSEGTVRTGDGEFDRVFKLDGPRPEAVLRLFSSPALRQLLLRIYGPSGSPDSTGILIAANEQGLLAHWSSPGADRAVDFGRSVAKAAERLSARRDFY
jgi:hypothetical protein